MNCNAPFSQLRRLDYVRLSGLIRGMGKLTEMFFDKRERRFRLKIPRYDKRRVIGMVIAIVVFLYLLDRQLLGVAFPSARRVMIRMLLICQLSDLRDESLDRLFALFVEFL